MHTVYHVLLDQHQPVSIYGNSQVFVWRDKKWNFEVLLKDTALLF